MSSPLHLMKRTWSSLSSIPPAQSDLEDVREILTPDEYELWRRQHVADQRHSIHIWRRFVVLCPQATVEEERAALLHDVGKLESGLGTVERIAATIIGPRTRRFRAYRDHCRIGGDMLQPISAPRTVELVVGCDDDVARLLKRADEI